MDDRFEPDKNIFANVSESLNAKNRTILHLA